MIERNQKTMFKIIILNKCSNKNIIIKIIKFYFIYHYKLNLYC